MKGMPFDFQKFQSEAVIEVAATACYWSDIKKSYNNKRKQQQQREGAEPCSVLESRRSPSPPTSTSTLSSSLGGGGGGGGGGGSSDSAGVAAVSENQQPTNKWQPNNNSSTEGGDKKEEWASELQPIAGSGGLDDWEAIISDSAVAGHGSPTHEQTFVRWIMGGDVDDCRQQHHLPPPLSADYEPFGALVDPGFGSAFDSSPSVSVAPPPPAPNQIAIAAASKAPFMPPVSANLPIFYQEAIEEKPLHLFGGNSHGLVINQQQQLHPPPNPGFFLPLPPQPQPQLEAGHPKRHHSMPPQSFPNPPATAAAAVPYSVQQRPPPKPKDEAAAAAVAQQQQQQQALVDQLLKAAELVETGNSFSAREILARLNHILPASPVGLKPLLRSAFLFKDILGVLANSPGSIPAPLSNPWDVVLKLSSYKAFSEVSPLIHFTNFTCTQTLLEEVAGADRIHIVDFDIGVGGQWSSFMQEFAHRRPTSTPFLRITAFVSPSAFHPLELHLTRDNVSHFAAELNIPFEFSFLSLESFNPNEILAVSADEAIAVNLPIGSHYAHSFPTLLRLVKQLNPKIVVSVDQGCDRGDLPFSHHFLHSFQACMVLLDSIDAAGTNADVATKIERFLVQPRVESAVLSRHRAVEKMPPWRALFASVGFVPCQFSNFTETQAECLLKRVQVRGFHVEKRQASLFLYWQRGELGSVSAWKC